MSPSGHWGFPGGHLEQGEDFFACVERETLEETGLEIRATKVVGLTNDKFLELDKHYVTVFTKSERTNARQEPEVRFQVAVADELVPCAEIGAKQMRRMGLEELARDTRYGE
jgi:8-oxo-dGTP pyrophosphatase MutT (NUDIX family)